MMPHDLENIFQNKQSICLFCSVPFRNKKYPICFLSLPNFIASVLSYSTFRSDYSLQCGKVTRHFNPGFYQKRAWLTAPAEGEPRLLCWPCLLFQPSGTADRWKKTGYTDLKNYASRMRAHETSGSHLEAVLKLYHFGKINQSADEATSASRVAHNERVKENREVMKRLVDVVVLLAKQGLFFPWPR